MKKVYRGGLDRFFLGVAAAVFGVLLSGTAYAQPGFSKTFIPDTIGPGSVSTLRFDIDNTGDPTPATDLAFTDNLPAAVTLATPANAVTTCGGTVSAPDGGTTIVFSGGSVGGGATCSLSVDVTSAVPGMGPYTNITGDLTSSAGNSGPASADLTVVTDRPGFTKAFSPASIPLGSRSTLTFTIDNTANTSTAYQLSFTDILPPGVVVAAPANPVSDCTGQTSITAEPGTDTIALPPLFSGGYSVPAGLSCTVSVDVVGTGTGIHVNTSDELLSTPVLFGLPDVSSGKANAALEVTVDPISLVKSFTDDPVPPGGIATLEFTIRNFDRNNAATNIAFTDDLGAALTGLAALPPLPANPCGTGSNLAGTSVLSLTGGNLPPDGSCVFSVQVQVPSAVPSIFVAANVTSNITGDLGGQGIVGAPAGDLLFIEPAPVLTKTFIGDPVGGGGAVTLEFTIQNTSDVAPILDIAFTDVLDAVIPGLLPSLPATPCGAGSVMNYIAFAVDTYGLEFMGGDLGPGGSCTFQVPLTVPVGAPAGTHVNSTSPITAVIDTSQFDLAGLTNAVDLGDGFFQVAGNPATDSLVVVAGPRLTKSFTDDPVLPGSTVTLEFTLEHDAFAPGDATGIAFTDDLSAVLAGLQATGLPQNDVCGTGSQISGTTTLSFTGGTLAPGSSCTFSVTLQVPSPPPAILPGNYTNTTSDVTATVLGVSTTGNPASDDLKIAGLGITKSFTDDPVIPGGTVTLQFTITNDSPTEDATDIVFTDDLNAVISGLQATGLPQNDICGAGSTVNGTSSLTFTGGNLLAGETCTFSVTLNVPSNAPSGIFINATSQLTATVAGSQVTLDPATDGLEVSSDFLTLTKTFTDDPVAPGDTATLEFTVTNTHPTQPVTAIAFADDLDAALTGLTAVSLPPAGFCGPASTISGTSLLTMTGGSLNPGAQCTFSVTVQVPALAQPGTVVNTTGQVTGDINGLLVTGDPASDTLRIDVVTFTKSFNAPTVPGGIATLTFTIENLSADPVVDLAFSDNLDAVVSGLSAVGLPATGVCGAGSEVTGTSVLAMTGGSLAAAGSCTFDVTVQVPLSASPGSYSNTTTALTAGGIEVSSPAVASLSLEPAPVFTKAFGPALIGNGSTSTLTFTIDNTASALSASNLDFTDNLPAGVVVATPPNALTTCTGGTLTAVAGSGVISYGGGVVAAGASCTVMADVTAVATGNHINTTGDLTSSSGNSGQATATLSVEPPPTFSKAFASGVIASGGVVGLTFTIDNTLSVTPATGLDFTDTLPVGMTVANPSNASTTCTGGTLTAVAGGNVISYTGGTVPAGTACTVSVDVTVAADGTYANTTDDLLSSLGNSGVANAILAVGATTVAAPALDVWGAVILSVILGVFVVRRLRYSRGLD